MKQGNASNATIDLDDLDRQLRSATSGPRRAGADDPLAELARIVGQDDPFGNAPARTPQPDRIIPSFDDFLKLPPRPASGGMPSHTPPVEPLFPQPASPIQAVRPPAFVDSSNSPDTPSVPTEETLFDLGLRPALSVESVALAPQEFGEASRRSDLDLLNDLEARLASAVRDDAGAPVAHEPSILQEPPPVEAEPVAGGVPGERFDDMLAEFEAAMRDVGAEKQPETVPSLAPAMVPPPPSYAPEVRYEPSDLGMAAAGAAVAGSGVVASAAVARRAPGRSRRGLMVAAGVIGVALIGVGSLLAFGNGAKTGSTKDAPVIAAKPGVTKERPANPGGVEVPNQDKEVLQPSASQNRTAERTVPREEQPVDLTQAQRSALAETSNGASVVRQIPGVSIIAPTSTTPPAGTAPSLPVARPVSSVPITIAGQPPAPATLAAPPVTTSVASPPTTAPAPQAVAPVPTTQPPAAAEPRRVRTVPIRPDDAAPTRAQAQPRVVPANPRPAPVAAAPEPEDANAPLRITPQANRSQQRVATAQPGTVPPSTAGPATLTPAAPQTTQTASATSGSGFTVQLAAEGSEDAARSKFNRVRGQHSSVLGTMSPNIRSAEVNGRSVYRVRVGSMSREEAVSLCERLKSDGGSCFVARN